MIPAIGTSSASLLDDDREYFLPRIRQETGGKG